MITLHFHSPHEISFYAKMLSQDERDKILIVEKNDDTFFVTHWSDGSQLELTQAEFNDLPIDEETRMIFLVPEVDEPAYKKPHLTESGHLKELRGYCEKIDKAAKELQEKSGPDGVRFYEQVLDNLDEIIAFFISFEVESDSVTEKLNEAITELNEIQTAPVTLPFH